MQLSHEKAIQIFTSTDLDGDGHINLTEFVQAILDNYIHDHVFLYVHVCLVQQFHS